MGKFILEKSGFPYEYSFRNYDEPSWGVGSSSFAEISSTLREMTEEQIIERLNSDIPQVQENTARNIQLAFDSGKMSVKKYKRLMGEDYCRREDCRDKKCLIYTLTCEKR